MTYRWATVLLLAMLLSTASAVWAPAACAANSNGDTPPSGKGSPAVRFAAAADETQESLSAPRKRPKKRSVLEPSTTRWLEEEDEAPKASGPAPDDLAPPELLSPAHGPPPEAIVDDFVIPGGPKAIMTSGQLSHPPDGTPLQMIPSHALRKQPMLRESWLFRPFNVSVFEGALFATAPVPQFHSATTFFTGFRLGWDFNTHFGGETRFGWAKVDFVDVSRTIGAGYEKAFYFDSNLLFYPWGDTRWRPFLSVGGGLGDIIVAGPNGLNLHVDTFNLPLGGGLKYRYGPRLAFRADIRDNLTLSGAGGLHTLNNVELLGGVEIHFGGGDRRSYWPWNPSHHWW